VAHILLVIPAIPKVIENPNGSLGAFIISILILAGAAGFIKPSLGPLLCDQSPVKVPTIKVLPSGERVIVDPGVTVERYLLVFYWCINVGAFFSLATTYASRFVGFWLAFLLPGILYMLMPIVLVLITKRLYKAPPQGSVVVEAAKVFKTLFKNGGFKRMLKGGDQFWEHAKPSFIEAQQGSLDLSVVYWDDKFVDELKQTVKACAVFALIPFFTLANGGIGNSVNSMTNGMTLNGVPNDLIGNFNALTIIVMAPVLNFGLYPLMAKIGYPLKPMTRMTIGFLLASIGSMIAAIIQWRIYQGSPCGYQASTCEEGVSSVSLWWQIPIIAIPACGELFVNVSRPYTSMDVTDMVQVTSYELAYTRSPARMKALVYALALFNSAIAAAISLACANAIQDPYLIWPWVALSCASFAVAWVFPTYFKHLNVPLSNFADEDRMAGLEQPSVLREKELAARDA
jgi:POT family proton-dependent oligopeptide transporter